MTPADDLTIKRVISNNAVLAVDGAAHEFVALGKGVGFGARPGGALDQERVEQVFLAGGDTPDDRLSQYLADIPMACIRAAGRIADLAHERLGIRVTQSLILPLADHLAFAVQRAQEGRRMDVPLLWEVRQLYPAEFAAGRDALEIADTTLGVTLDRDEAVAIAMHLVNVQFSRPGLRSAMQMTETIAQVFSLVERTFGIEVDRESMNAARFVTHLRYVFARVESGQQIADPQPTLHDAIMQAHPQAMACAAKIQYFVEMAFRTPLTPDETAYLGLHVARLVADVRDRPAV